MCAGKLRKRYMWYIEGAGLACNDEACLGDGQGLGS